MKKKNKWHMTIFLMDLLNIKHVCGHVTTPLILFVTPSPHLGSYLFGGTTAQPWRTTRRNSGIWVGVWWGVGVWWVVGVWWGWGLWWGCHPCLGFSYPHILLCQKSSRVTCCVERGIDYNILNYLSAPCQADARVNPLLR